MEMNKAKGHLAMLGANVMWGLMSPVAKMVFAAGVVAPMVMVDFRVAGARYPLLAHVAVSASRACAAGGYSPARGRRNARRAFQPGIFHRGSQPDIARRSLACHHDDAHVGDAACVAYSR